MKLRPAGDAARGGPVAARALAHTQTRCSVVRVRVCACAIGIEHMVKEAKRKKYRENN